MECMYVCMYMHVCLNVYSCYGTCVKVREQLQESVLAFHHVGSSEETQAIGFDGKHLYP